MASAELPDGPCSGYRVIDFTTMVSGPLCTQILGDLGADVIKVEAPPVGDTSRVTGGAQRDGQSGLFAQLNRNKRSIVIDLRDEAGRELARDLVAAADVLVQNFRPGVAERLGIGYEELRQRAPELIWVAISGFGPDGPYAGLPAYDHVVQGISGFMTVQGTPDEPRMIQSVVVDKASGVAAASATVAALLARARTGRGQRVDVPMLDAFAAYMLPDILGGNAFPEQPLQDNPRMRRMFRTWRTLDGHIVGIVIQDSQFEGFCRMVEREDLIADPRFATLEARFGRLEEFYDLMEREFLEWPSAVLVERARRFGAPFGPVHDLEAFLDDPQTAHNRTVFEVQDASGRRTRQLAHAVRYAGTPATYRRQTPGLGEHTDEVLAEVGLDPGRIARLREAGVIR